MPSKYFAAPAVLAAAALVATPAAAVDLPLTRSAPVAATGAEVSHYGPIVTIGGSSWGWRGGHRGRHHRRGSTAGDILTGVLILGTIAAVANAAKRAERRPYPERYPFPDRPNDYRPQGLEGAADLCLREVERDARANEVTRVERNAGGWLVTGSMADGAAFSCSIGADGRIDRIEIGGQTRELGSADDDSEVYRTASADDAGPQPAYPGGPLPGEDGEAEVDVDADSDPET